MLRPHTPATVPPLTQGADPAGPEHQRSDVAVVGGGASGTLTATPLMASGAPDLTNPVHDASGEVAKGPASGTSARRHLLNGRSRHMSAFPDIPSDLVECTRRTGREPDA